MLLKLEHLIHWRVSVQSVEMEHSCKYYSPIAVVDIADMIILT